MRVTLLFAGICILAQGLSCPSETIRAPQRQSAQNGDEVVLFITGNELGALKPCGCSGGQLGGLEKRAGIFAAVPKANRLLIDTGNLVRRSGEQDAIKFRILFEAFGLLGYDMVHLTAQDLEMAGQLNILSEHERVFRVLSAGEQGGKLPQVLTKRFSAGGGGITVNVAAFDMDTGGIGQTAGLFPDDGQGGTVNVVIVSGGQGHEAEDLPATAPPSVDCIIVPSDSDEPRVLSDAGERPLVLTTGRLGRYVCRLGMAVAEPGGRPALRFTVIPVAETLPDDEVLVHLYRSYQQLVKESGLLEQYPRLPLPGNPAFVGSRTCRRCHEYEYEQWSTKSHADAFATLKKVGSDHDPECVICHVVGMEYAEGFITEERTPHLKDVGCENCHGPGSEHVQTLGQAKTTEPKMSCLTCHTPEHSGGYAGNEEEFMQKIVHWREP